ncbi:MAG: hypothetical protein AAFV43_15435 [Planctomycetota bacterium]
MANGNETRKYSPEVQRAHGRLLFQKVKLVAGSLGLLVIGLSICYFLSTGTFSGINVDGGAPWQFYVGGPLAIIGGVVTLWMAFRTGWGIEDMVSESLLEDE